MTYLQSHIQTHACAHMLMCISADTQVSIWISGWFMLHWIRWISQFPSFCRLTLISSEDRKMKGKFKYVKPINHRWKTSGMGGGKELWLGGKVAVLWIVNVSSDITWHGKYKHGVLSLFLHFGKTIISASIFAGRWTYSEQ